MTLAQAREELAYATNAYNEKDLTRSINRALRALVSLHPLKCLRKVYRFRSAGPEFVLPQGCAGLVRACVNGCPVTMRGQDFRFLQAGPGDMDSPGFVPVSNIADLGVRPVMNEPRRPFRLYAVVEDGEWVVGEQVEARGPQPTVIVRGVAYDGTEARMTLPIFRHDALVAGVMLKPCPEEGDDPETKYITSGTDPLFAAVTSITISKPKDAGYVPKYVNICAQDWENPYCTFAIASCNPHETNPKFRHYELVGYPEGVPCDILAEVRMGHVDLVDDADELPFDTAEPVGWMIRANWEDNAGEVARADQFRAKAEAWLKRQDETDKTVQTKVTVNSTFPGSQGEVSMRALNV